LQIKHLFQSFESRRTKSQISLRKIKSAAVGEVTVCLFSQIINYLHLRVCRQNEINMVMLKIVQINQINKQIVKNKEMKNQSISLDWGD